jgi:hypothetical protein
VRLSQQVESFRYGRHFRARDGGRDAQCWWLEQGNCRPQAFGLAARQARAGHQLINPIALEEVVWQP